MSSSIHQTVSSATFLKSIQYHLCVGCHPRQQSGHLSLKQILLENKEHEEIEKERGYRAHFFLFHSIQFQYEWKNFFLWQMSLKFVK